jgi:hypothetical protein
LNIKVYFIVFKGKPHLAQEFYDLQKRADRRAPGREGELG